MKSPVLLPPLHLQHLAFTNVLSNAKNLTTLGTLRKWDQAVFEHLNSDNI